MTYNLSGDVKVITVATASTYVSVFTKLKNDYSSFPNETCSILYILRGNYTLKLHRDTVYSRQHGITSEKRLITTLTTLKISDILIENSRVCHLILCFCKMWIQKIYAGDILFVNASSHLKSQKSDMNFVSLEAIWGYQFPKTCNKIMESTQISEWGGIVTVTKSSNNSNQQQSTAATGNSKI